MLYSDNYYSLNPLGYTLRNTFRYLLATDIIDTYGTATTFPKAGHLRPVYYIDQ